MVAIDPTSSRALSPYTAGAAVGGLPNFVGRAAILEQIEDSMQSQSANTVLLFGQRRIGKTSILLELQSRLKRQGHAAVYFDLQKLSGKSVDEVGAAMADAIAQELHIPRPDLGLPGGPALRDTWLGQAVPTDRTLAILVDEADAAGGGDVYLYLQTLLGLRSRHLALVFTIGRKVDDLDSTAKALFKGVEAIHVSSLNRSEVEELVRLSEKNGTLAWSAEAVDAIWALCQGHAYLTQQLCSQVWRKLVKRSSTIPLASAADVESMREITIDRSRVVLEWFWDGLTPACKFVASVLASQREEAVSAEQLRVLLSGYGLSTSAAIDDAPRLLEGWDLIERISSAEAGPALYRFKVPLVRRWISDAKPLKEVLEEADKVDERAHKLYLEAHALTTGNRERAIELLEEALRRNPTHVGATRRLVELYNAQDQPGRALSAARALYERRPGVGKVVLLHQLLDVAKAQKDRDQALIYYQQAREIAPDHPDVAEQIRSTLHAMAEAALADGKYKDASKRFAESGAADKALLADRVARERVRTLLVIAVSGVLVCAAIAIILSALYFPLEEKLAGSARAMEHLKGQHALELQELLYEQRKTLWLPALTKIVREIHAPRLQLVDSDNKLTPDGRDSILQMENAITERLDVNTAQLDKLLVKQFVVFAPQNEMVAADPAAPRSTVYYMVKVNVFVRPPNVPPRDLSFASWINPARFTNERTSEASDPKTQCIGISRKGGRPIAWKLACKETPDSQEAARVTTVCPSEEWDTTRKGAVVTADEIACMTLYERQDRRRLKTWALLPARWCRTSENEVTVGLANTYSGASSVAMVPYVSSNLAEATARAQRRFFVPDEALAVLQSDPSGRGRFGDYVKTFLQPELLDSASAGFGILLKEVSVILEKADFAFFSSKSVKGFLIGKSVACDQMDLDRVGYHLFFVRYPYSSITPDPEQEAHAWQTGDIPVTLRPILGSEDSAFAQKVNILLGLLERPETNTEPMPGGSTRGVRMDPMISEVQRSELIKFAGNHYAPMLAWVTYYPTSARAKKSTTTFDGLGSHLTNRGKVALEAAEEPLELPALLGRVLGIDTPALEANLVYAVERKQPGAFVFRYPAYDMQNKEDYDAMKRPWWRAVFEAEGTLKFNLKGRQCGLTNAYADYREGLSSRTFWCMTKDDRNVALMIDLAYHGERRPSPPAAGDPIRERH